MTTGNWTFHICILVPVCHTQKNTFPNGESDRVGLGGFLPSIYRLCICVCVQQRVKITFGEREISRFGRTVKSCPFRTLFGMRNLVGFVTPVCVSILSALCAIRTIQTKKRPAPPHGRSLLERFDLLIELSHGAA